MFVILPHLYMGNGNPGSGFDAQYLVFNTCTYESSFRWTGKNILGRNSGERALAHGARKYSLIPRRPIRTSL